MLAPVLLALTMASSITTFQTPSHGIACAYSTSPASLRCDVRDVADRPKRPKSCELDYGDAFGLDAQGRARRLCVGDTVADPKAKVIAYGTTQHHGPFTCTSRTTGLRCATKAGHGFSLSRETQKLF
ncbi:MAG TPA: DUF6636 domain-containing protein [Baekduia sp.]|uniref:DUF6636 domain-containing protein n=1 Tax=Baekduia sp. TaxID=2600305 RepID=UPI002D76A893|nr:DUF6636 domain-containing protein [Baekduia sp.]HET6505836.1 DUF6636 domain-containing protein [Baekduia sp.]